MFTACTTRNQTDTTSRSDAVILQAVKLAEELRKSRHIPKCWMKSNSSKSDEEEEEEENAGGLQGFSVSCRKETTWIETEWRVKKAAFTWEHSIRIIIKTSHIKSSSSRSFIKLWNSKSVRLLLTHLDGSSSDLLHTRQVCRRGLEEVRCWIWHDSSTSISINLK